MGKTLRNHVGLAAAATIISALTFVSQGPQAADEIRGVKQIARESSCRTYSWRSNRGVAPRSYIEGMALVYARAICNRQWPEVKAISLGADLNKPKKDALTAYKDKYSEQDVDVGAPGLGAIRNTYTLLIGLGMMESSGKYCEGRDVSQCFVEADNAESGLFQTSYGARLHSKEILEGLYERYKNGERNCMLAVFQGDLTCRIHKSRNQRCPDETSDIAGDGEGANWQRLTKTCPAFAAEYAALVVRVNGGTQGEFGPIRVRKVEVRPECRDMLAQIENYVGENPAVCQQLR